MKTATQSNIPIHAPLGQIVRRSLLVGALITAAAAVVVLGDNGIPTGAPTGAAPIVYSQAESPALSCQRTALAQLDDPGLVPRLGFQPAADPIDLGTNSPPNDNTNCAPCIANGTTCSVVGSCTNRNLQLNFNFEWCCDTNKKCYVRAGGGWIRLTQWLQFNLGGCVVAVGCK